VSSWALSAAARAPSRHTLLFAYGSSQDENSFQLSDANAFVRTAGLTGDNTSDIAALEDGRFIDSWPAGPSDA
jgi:hypothetical protein